MRRLVIMRSEPGLTASAERAASLGLDVVKHPLFAVEAIEWSVPPGHFEGLVLTSANAVRHAGPRLADVRHLGVYAVGDATAEAARSAGMTVVAVGTGGVEGLDLPEGRLLHLCGERHRTLPGEVVAVPVYRTLPIAAKLPDLDQAVVAVHSPAAGERLASLVRQRSSTRIAAISAAAAKACGDGWEAVGVAASPDDLSLLALASSLCHSGDV